jgi:hypothetical protein
MRVDDYPLIPSFAADTTTGRVITVTGELVTEDYRENEKRWSMISYRLTGKRRLYPNSLTGNLKKNYDMYMEERDPHLWGSSAYGNYSPSLPGRSKRDEVGSGGGRVLVLSGTDEAFTSHVIPVDTDKKYFGGCRVRQVVDPTSGTALISFGVVTMDANYDPLGTPGDHRWNVVDGVTVEEVDGWLTFEGAIEGIGSQDSNFRTGTKYIRLVAKYESLDGELEIDYFSLKEDGLGYYEVSQESANVNKRRGRFEGRAWGITATYSILGDFSYQDPVVIEKTASDNVFSFDVLNPGTDPSPGLISFTASLLSSLPVNFIEGILFTEVILMSPGQVLTIDGRNYTATLDGVNILDKLVDFPLNGFDIQKEDQIQINGIDVFGPMELSFVPRFRIF